MMVHIGAKYYDAYGSRMSRYSVLSSLRRSPPSTSWQRPYTDFAEALCDWIPGRIGQHIEERLACVPTCTQRGDPGSVG